MTKHTRLPVDAFGTSDIFDFQPLYADLPNAARAKDRYAISLEETLVDASPIVTPQTLIATYKSGIQDVKFKANFIEYRDNGQKIKVDADSSDVPGNLEDPMNIDISFYGDGWTQDLIDPFVAASEFLSDMIASGLIDDTAFSTVTGEALAVDDLVIEASLVSDVSGGFVGGAQIQAVRSSDGSTPDGLPVLSTMTFDVDTAQALQEIGVWDDLVLHEMVHAMGFGSPLWFADTLSIDTSRGVDGLFADFGTFQVYYADYEGESVAQVAAAEGGDTTPALSAFAISIDNGASLLGPFQPFPEFFPLDTVGHWSEEFYDDALMTPVLSDEENVLLDITLASMGDLGYELAIDLVAENNPLSEGIQLVAENNVKFTDFAEDVLMF